MLKNYVQGNMADYDFDYSMKFCTVYFVFCKIFMES